MVILDGVGSINPAHYNDDSAEPPKTWGISLPRRPPMQVQNIGDTFNRRILDDTERLARKLAPPLGKFRNERIRG